MTASAAVHQPLPHESAELHVSGEARYVDDLPEPPGLLHAALGLADIAHGVIRALDLAAVVAAPGVCAVLTAADIPGENNIGPVIADEPVFPIERVSFHGQALYAVLAESASAARRAARLHRLAADPLPAVLTLDEAMARDRFVLPSHSAQRGEPRAAIAAAPHRLNGRLRCGGQEHFYLEGQVAMAIPGEAGQMTIHVSSQHPSEIQHLVAASLGIANAAVTVEVRRMGGAFGGKETQAALYAVVCALGARKTGRPVKLRLDRDDDFRLTGKRHDFRIAYEVGFDADGRILGVDFELASRCGISADLSGAVNDRAMFHIDNAYFLPHVRVVSHRCRTNTVSNTAFRGFGAPQGMFAIEGVIDAIARALGRDPLEVRRRNLYGAAPRDTTHYGMRVTDNVLPELIADLAKRAGYAERRARVRAWNERAPQLRRGIALTPVKFGVSFTAIPMNQAGALVHLYTDGSVQVNHGGTEMGQGLHTKVAQIAADALGVAIEQVRIGATSTGKVPNTSPTAASSGSDLNGEAVRAACATLRERLVAHCVATHGVVAEEVGFAGGRVRIGALRETSFAEVVREAFLARVPLSATGYFRTPSIHFDRAAFRGEPFYYFAYGAAIAEVAVDTLSGEHRVLRADLLHDVGRSLNPAIDLGQIEGGFIQGMGWLTTEELVWNGAGALATHAPSTYKIPATGDVPALFDARIWPRGANRRDIAHRSKAVGEPPLMLALSVFHAIADAVASLAEGRPVPLDAPATPEAVLRAIHRITEAPFP